MTQYILLPFEFLAVRRKKVKSDFRGEPISSPAVWSCCARRTAGLAWPTLWRAACGTGATWRWWSRRSRRRLRFHMFAITFGSRGCPRTGESKRGGNANDCDGLRTDHLFIRVRPQCSRHRGRWVALHPPWPDSSIMDENRMMAGRPDELQRPSGFPSALRAPVKPEGRSYRRHSLAALEGIGSMRLFRTS